MEAYADLLGDIILCPGPIARSDIKRRKSVQDRKDALRAQLKRLIEVPPKSLGSAGIEKTRHWMALATAAKKVYKSERSSVPQLEAAINTMKWDEVQ